MTEKQLYQIMKDLKWNSNQYEYYKKEYAKTHDHIDEWWETKFEGMIGGMFQVLDTIMTEDEIDKIQEWLESDEEPTLLYAKRWWQAHK